MLPRVLPTPRTQDPMDAPPLRWGVLGTGWIAERFAAALRASTRQEVYAVGSRSLATADRFAARVGAPAAYGSYEQLVADPAVDVVYVATPHNHHHPHARLSLEAGKPTVVEKPMALNAAQCRDLDDLARSQGTFLMEAMWTLFLPKYDVIRQLLEGGALGEVHAVLADMGEHFEPEHRIWRADLAGGPLLDLGTYPVMLATWTLGGAPAHVTAEGTFTAAGLNTQAGAILRSPGEQFAILHTTQLGNTPTTATVQGSVATLEIDGPFYQPGPFVVRGVDADALRWEEERVAHAALHYQAAEVARRITAGESGSPLRPVTETITTMAAMDEIRRRLGITYAEERDGATSS